MTSALFPTTTTAAANVKIQPLNAKAVLWDVDGTLADSYRLGYDSTQKVLQLNGGRSSITEEEYHEGTKYTTPRRLAWHVTNNPDDSVGILLGQQFDDLYVKLVSKETASFYPGIRDTIDRIKSYDNNIRLGALSNACGDYVRAVLAVNEVSHCFDCAYGADEVTRGDSPSDGQAATAAGMQSIGVTWGSHSIDKIKPAFTYIAYTINELNSYIIDCLSKMD